MRAGAGLGHSVSVNVLPVTTALVTNKALLFPTNRRSSTVYSTRVAVLQSRQNHYQDGTRQETHFLYPCIKMKRGTVNSERMCIRADAQAVTSCYLPERRGLFGFEDWMSFLILQSSCCSFTGSLLAEATCKMFHLFPGSYYSAYCF